jgi:tetratricopeptide (TPR) repeat protein
MSRSPRRPARAREQSDTARSPRALRTILGVAAVAVAIAAYLNALDNPFVYDDTDTVLLNRSLVDLSNFRFILVYSRFRPVVNVSYAIDRAIWGYTSFGFHVTNVALHAIAVGLFFGWCTRAFADAYRSDGTVRPEWPSFFAASLFAVHPMLTEGAGYVSGRSEVLCSIGFLGCLILARRAIQKGAVLPAAGAIVAAVFALASKETAVAAPVVLLAYDAWVLSPSAPRGGEVQHGWRRRLWRVYIPAFAVLAVGAVIRFRTLVSAGALIDRHPLDNLLTQAIVIWRYIGLLVLPVGQTILHDVRFVTSSADPAALLALAGLAALVTIAIRMRARDPLIAVGVVWFLAALAPSSSVIPLREGMAEHRVYLASGGFFVAITALAARPLSTRAGARLAASVVLIVCVLLTVRRNLVWSDATTLWAEAAMAAPSTWEPHFAYADALREAGQCDRAIPEYRAVLDLRPRHRDAVINMGICLAQAGDATDAEDAFRTAIEIDPAWPRGYTNLAALAITRGEHQQARDLYREAIARDPKNVLARMQLAKLYESVFHEYELAARLCEEVRGIDPAASGTAECVDRNHRLAAGGAEGR